MFIHRRSDKKEKKKTTKKSESNWKLEVLNADLRGQEFNAPAPRPVRKGSVLRFPLSRKGGATGGLREAETLGASCGPGRARWPGGRGGGWPHWDVLDGKTENSPIRTLDALSHVEGWSRGRKYSPASRKMNGDTGAAPVDDVGPIA